MKKLLSAFFLLSVLALSAYSQDKIFAKVEAVSGKVEIYKGNTWSSLTEGALLNRGDIISTGFNSEAVILIKDSRVKLAALTRMTVEQLAENDVKEETRLFIDTGKVSASVKHAENKRTDFKVRSPVSTASVRGTEFDFFAIGKIATTLGLVSASASSSPVFSFTMKWTILVDLEPHPFLLRVIRSTIRNAAIYHRFILPDGIRKSTTHPLLTVGIFTIVAI